MIPKKKSNDDVELGLGKAGLASMETLDDSLKESGYNRIRIDICMVNEI